MNEWGEWWVSFGEAISSLLGVPAGAVDWEADAAVIGEAIAAEFAMVWNAGAVMADATRVVEQQPILEEI